MMLIAIGESLKYLDTITGGDLLRRRPEVDWDGAKGIRDILSHHYQDVDAEIVYNVCREKMTGLLSTINAMQEELKDDRP